jgi:hypothetical protein
MNLRRGLFRLSIVGAALFVLAVAFVSYADIKEEFEAAASVPAPLVTDPEVIKRLAPRWEPVTDPTLLKWWERKNRPPTPWASLKTAAAIALGIPLAVLALGSSCCGPCLGSLLHGTELQQADDGGHEAKTAFKS